MYVPKGTYVVRAPVNPPRLDEPKGKEISGEIQENSPAEKYFNLKEVNNATKKRFPYKKLVSAEEAEAFFQKMKMTDYEIIDQLRKSPAQVSLLSLLMDSTEHQKVLIKTLNEAYVPIETTIEQLERMTERVMLDGGSGVDISPLSTLQRMEIGTEKIRPNNGRPWIHAAGVVPYTLHQMVKFEHEDQEIVVHKEDEQSIYRDPSVPCLEAKEGSEHIVYQAFKIVVADQCEEGNLCPQPFLSNASILVAKEMIRYGYKPKKGLGKSLQGITEPIILTASEKFFGVLPQLVPYLYRTFVRPKYNEEEEDEAFTAEEIEEICGAMRQILYETHMVQPGEGLSTAKVLMDEEDVEKITFTTPYGTYCYRVMPFAVKEDATIKWTDECQEAFEKIKEYLSIPPILVPPDLGKPLFLYFIVLENSFGYVLGQHDVTGRKEQAIYYLSKKFTSFEAKYTLLERTCCALTWVAQKLRHYLLAYTTYLITRLDPLKYIFQKPMPIGRLAKWQILLTEFDIVNATRKEMKAQALADHLAENPVDDEDQPLSTYFPNEEVNLVEAIFEDTNAWKMFFDGAEAKGKFSPNWKGPYIIRKILPRGALYLGDIEGNDPEVDVNADAVKRYYV
ncbi:uncharacterized protein LOC142176208 [Nicotiana tabacum]|uniref:Uncharacterized protein LOC142176208 n=1 Tax=Nicotiana tabacum TaxID=4097 RepID=A0AC58TQC5_TOBAC